MRKVYWTLRAAGRGKKIVKEKMAVLSQSNFDGTAESIERIAGLYILMCLIWQEREREILHNKDLLCKEPQCVYTIPFSLYTHTQTQRKPITQLQYTDWEMRSAEQRSFHPFALCGTTPRYNRKWPHIIHASHYSLKQHGRDQGGHGNGWEARGVRNRRVIDVCVCVPDFFLGGRMVGMMARWGGKKATECNWIVFQARHIQTHWLTDLSFFLALLFFLLGIFSLLYEKKRKKYLRQFWEYQSS